MVIYPQYASHLWESRSTIIFLVAFIWIGHQVFLFLERTLFCDFCIFNIMPSAVWKVLKKVSDASVRCTIMWQNADVQRGVDWEHAHSHKDYASPCTWIRGSSADEADCIRKEVWSVTEPKNNGTDRGDDRQRWTSHQLCGRSGISSTDEEHWARLYCANAPHNYEHSDCKLWPEKGQQLRTRHAELSIMSATNNSNVSTNNLSEIIRTVMESVIASSSSALPAPTCPRPSPSLNHAELPEAPAATPPPAAVPRPPPAATNCQQVRPKKKKKKVVILYWRNPTYHKNTPYPS